MHLFFLLLLFGSDRLWAQSDIPAFMGVDIYGTDRFTADAVQQEFGDKIRLFADKNWRETHSKPKKPVAQKIKKEIEEIIKKQWKFAWVQLSWMNYYRKGENAVYVTVDVVEPQEKKTRMSFRRPPMKTFPDPSRLSEMWTQYTELGWSLVRSGEIKSDRVPCPAFYCIWGAQTPALKDLQDSFIKLVPKNESRLRQILKEDKDPVHRANAAFLLSYAPNGSQLSYDLQSLLRDPDADVRGAAMKIYAEMAVFHKEIYLPIDKIVEFLDYPTVEDRSRALDVLVSLADQPSYREILINRAGPILLKFLRLQQPANHDMAYAVLGILSRENYDAKDIVSWQRWLKQSRTIVPRSELAPAAKP